MVVIISKSLCFYLKCINEDDERNGFFFARLGMSCHLLRCQVTCVDYFSKKGIYVQQ